MTKEKIIAEIRRTAEENGGEPLRKQKFFLESGIKESDWSGRFWIKWSDALQEAGYVPCPSGKLARHQITLLLSSFPVQYEGG